MNNKGKPYEKLRNYIQEKGYTLKRVREGTNINSWSWTQKMQGYYPFTMDEVYSIIEFLGISDDKIHIYFPRRTAEMKAYVRPPRRNKAYDENN